MRLRLASIDVDLAHVIGDDSNARILAVVEDVVEKRRITGIEEAGQDRNGVHIRSHILLHHIGLTEKTGGAGRPRGMCIGLSACFRQAGLD